MLEWRLTQAGKTLKVILYIQPPRLLRSNSVIPVLLLSENFFLYVLWRVWLAFHSLIARFAFLRLISFPVIQLFSEIHSELHLFDNLFNGHMRLNSYFIFRFFFWQNNEIYCALIILEDLSLGKLHHITVFARIMFKDITWLDTSSSRFWILLLIKIVILLHGQHWRTPWLGNVHRFGIYN